MANYLDKSGLQHLWTSLKGKFVAQETGKGLSTNDFTNELMAKLNGIEEGANKYEHATHTSAASGFYKVTVDTEGHVSAVTPVLKADVVALGIPAQDTVYEHATHDEHVSDLYKVTVDAEGHVSAAVKVTKADLADLIGNASQSEAGLMAAADKTKVDGVETGAQVNIIESVSVNGAALGITDKGVDITVPTGALATKDQVAETDLEAALKTKINGKAEQTEVNSLTQTVNGHTTAIGENATAAEAARALAASKQDPATSLAGYGITDAYTKTEIDGKISSVYKACGNVEFAALPSPSEANLGNVYNVSDAFTTTENFVEGAGKTHPAGTNVAIVKIGDAYKYDAMAGFVDLSDYAKTADFVAISNSEIDAILAS